MFMDFWEITKNHAPVPERINAPKMERFFLPYKKLLLQLMEIKFFIFKK